MTNEQLEETLIMCDSTERLSTFLEISKACKLSNKKYWKHLYESYVNSDRILEQLELDEVKDLFDSNRTCKAEWIMTKRELRELDRLPEMVTIYRGCSEEESGDEEYGISWTTKREVAEWFANRIDGVVVEMVIHKDSIKAYMLSRSEYEVIVTDL